MSTTWVREARTSALVGAGVASGVAYWLLRRRRKEEALVLTYLDAPGAGEAIRLALFVGRVPFEDERVSYEEVAERRRRRLLPCGQVPTLTVGAETCAAARTSCRARKPLGARRGRTLFET